MQWRVSAPLIQQKSRFIGRAIRVRDLDTVQKLLKELKTEHRDATHHISAYRLSSGAEGSNNNGEGNAGERILNMLKHRNATDILVVVNRWYGGQKMGADRFRAIDKVARDAVNELK